MGALASAQTAAPGAGEVSRQLENRAPELPVDRKGAAIELPPPLQTAPGGARVVLREFTFRGNTLFSAEALSAVLQPQLGRPLDMAGLRALTDLVAGYYADRGYPFVRVYLPEQNLGAGVLQMIVVEGRYGAIRIEPPQNLPPALQFPSSVVPAIEDFLSNIRVGEIIEAKTLERSTLLLEDQPGVKVTPIIQPGQAAGTGDLMVRYQRVQPFQVEVGVDNHGSRFTGDLRAKADLTWNSPFAFGDQVRVSAMRTSQHLTLGSLAYSGLINGSGLRWRTALSYTDYTLGKDYASLLRSGVAQTRSLGVSYPLVRSQAANLTVVATAQDKRFVDSDGVNQTRENKSSASLPVSVQFDFRDQILGGGINYGYATITRGAIQLHGTALDNDQAGARTDGLFTKREVDFSRLQALPGAMSLYLRGYQQAVHKKNLDASEGVSFGGPTGVRAYPVGEASGDKGWLVQMELRYTAQQYSAYVFADHARVKVNAVAYDSSANLREIAGAGLGARVSRKLTDGQTLSADLSVAWSTGGGAAQSDSAPRTPRIWLSTVMRF